jgi:hypothetical protein
MYLRYLSTPGKGRIAFKYVGLHNAEIDAASENNVFGVLKCPGSSDVQKPQRNRICSPARLRARSTV